RRWGRPATRSSSPRSSPGASPGTERSIGLEVVPREAHGVGQLVRDRVAAVALTALALPHDLAEAEELDRLDLEARAARDVDRAGPGRELAALAANALHRVPLAELGDAPDDVDPVARLRARGVVDREGDLRLRDERVRGLDQPVEHRVAGGL